MVKNELRLDYRPIKSYTEVSESFKDISALCSLVNSVDMKLPKNATNLEMIGDRASCIFSFLYKSVRDDILPKIICLYCIAVIHTIPRLSVRTMLLAILQVVPSASKL